MTFLARVFSYPSTHLASCRPTESCPETGFAELWAGQQSSAARFPQADISLPTICVRGYSLIGEGDPLPDMIMLRPFEQERFDRLVELARSRFDTVLTQPEALAARPP